MRGTNERLPRIISESADSFSPNAQEQIRVPKIIRGSSSPRRATREEARRGDGYRRGIPTLSSPDNASTLPTVSMTSM